MQLLLNSFYDDKISRGVCLTKSFIVSGEGGHIPSFPRKLYFVQLPNNVYLGL